MWLAFFKGLLSFGLVNICKTSALTMDFSQSFKDMYMIYVIFDTDLGDDKYLMPLQWLKDS